MFLPIPLPDTAHFAPILYAHPPPHPLRNPMAQAFLPAPPVPHRGSVAARDHLSTLSPPRTFLLRASPAPSPHLAVRPAAQGGPDSSSSGSSSPEVPDGGPQTELADTPFPALYDAWFGPNHELRNQMQSSVTAAVKSGATALELQWPVVPNLEEISAGTLLNYEFGKYVASELGMSAAADYALVRRYLASFCNLYWARCVAAAPAFRGRVVWAVATDSVSRRRAESRLDGLRLTTLREAARRDAQLFGDDDVVIVIDPRFDDIWRKAMQLKPSNGHIVFLNSQFNESYGLTGPRRGPLRDVVAAYFLKRVTRGYVFRAFPGPWRACLEKPDLGVEELDRFDEEPKLRDVANIVRTESNNRYGGFFNDRYVRGFGGRL